MLSRRATTVPGGPWLRRVPTVRARRVPAVRLLVSPTALIVALGTAFLGTVLLGAAPASAHARFAFSDPAEGSRLPALPATVVLSYTEDVAPQFVDTAVITPDGTTVPTPASAAGVDVTVDLARADETSAAAQAGTWQVVARVVSADGHPVEHTMSFVLAPPAQPAGASTDAVPATSTVAADRAADQAADQAADGAAEPVGGEAAEVTAPATVPAASPTDGLPRWAAVAGAAVLVVAAAAALLLQLRRRPPTG